MAFLHVDEVNDLNVISLGFQEPTRIAQQLAFGLCLSSTDFGYTLIKSGFEKKKRSSIISLKMAGSLVYQAFHEFFMGQLRIFCRPQIDNKSLLSDLLRIHVFLVLLHIAVTSHRNMLSAHRAEGVPLHL